jgi:hypothetical protein
MAFTSNYLTSTLISIYNAQEPPYFLLSLEGYLIASLIDQYCRQQVRSENLMYLKRFKRPRSQGHNHNALHASRSAIEEALRYALSVTVTCCPLHIKSFQYYNR